MWERECPYCHVASFLHLAVCRVNNNICYYVGISYSHLREARLSQLLILIIVDDTDDVTLSHDTSQDVTRSHVTLRDTLTELGRKCMAVIKHK